MTTQALKPIKRPISEVWFELSRTIDDARGLALIADSSCTDLIGDHEARDNAQRALLSATSELLAKAAALIPMLEP